MLRKNVAGQHVFFALVNATTGAALTGATVAGKMSLDAAAQAAVNGTFTEMGLGQYRFDPTQADTNADFVGYLFTAAGAIPVNFNFITTGGDFRQATNFGMTNLDAAISSRSTYAGADTAGTTTLLGRVTGVVPLAVDYTTARAVKLDNLDATISSRLATAGYTVPPTTGAIATAVLTDTVDTLGAALLAVKAQTDKLLFDGTSFVKANTQTYAAGQDPATLVLDVSAAAHNTANTIGAKINAAGGAADPWNTQLPGAYPNGSAGKLLASAGAAADPLANQVPGAYASGSAGAVLGSLSGLQLTVVSPLATTGQLTLVQGDDYKAVDGRAIAFVNAAGTWPNLAGAAIAFAAVKSNQVAVGPVAGTVVTASGPNQKVQVELPASQTKLLAPAIGAYDQYLYSVIATLANGDVITLTQGNLFVNPA